MYLFQTPNFCVENFNRSRQVTLHHSILYHANLLNICSARKLDEKQLLSAMVTAVLIFLGPWHMSHRWAFANALWLHHHHSRWILRDLPPWLLTLSLTPFSRVLCATSLCHTIPGLEKQTLPPSPSVTTSSTTQSTSLHFWDKPYNSPQWAISGWRWAKAMFTWAMPAGKLATLTPFQQVHGRFYICIHQALNTFSTF